MVREAGDWNKESSVVGDGLRGGREEGEDDSEALISSVVESSVNKYNSSVTGRTALFMIEEEEEEEQEVMKECDEVCSSMSEPSSEFSLQLEVTVLCRLSTSQFRLCHTTFPATKVCMAEA